MEPSARKSERTQPEMLRCETMPWNLTGTLKTRLEPGEGKNYWSNGQKKNRRPLPRLCQVSASSVLRCPMAWRDHRTGAQWTGLLVTQAAIFIRRSPMFRPAVGPMS